VGQIKATQGANVTQAFKTQVLSPAHAYALWAPDYERETAVSLLDDALVGRLTPSLSGRRLLDVGCGTGRRMRTAGARVAVGVEPSREMIAAGAPALMGREDVTVIEGDARSLPVESGCFDVVWCRLVLGHVAALAVPYAEMARALADGGTVIVSDFHSAAYDRGHRRTFRSGNSVWEIETYSHALAHHVAAADAAGLALVQQDQACVGPEIRELYVAAGRAAHYEEHLGLPLVFALRFERA
jgi:malonyl-CoA O-methyltransferase